MNEEQWLTSKDPQAMLAFLKRAEKWPWGVLGQVWGRAWRPSHRKLRLFACACCRRGCNLAEEESIRSVVEASESYADGLADSKALKAAAKRALAWLGDCHLAAGASVGSLDVWEAVSWERDMSGRRVATGRHTGQRTDLPLDRDLISTRLTQERSTQSHLLRDLFGNLFHLTRPLSASLLAWNGGIVKQLAQSAYDNRLLPSGQLDPQRLAVLADALEEAGCNEADIQGHLRQPGPHYLGCWALDLLTGRE